MKEPTPSQELDWSFYREFWDIVGRHSKHWNYSKTETITKLQALFDKAIKQHELSRKQEWQEWVEKYDELIMAVGNKYAGETRHETALRYIKSCENSSNTQSKTIKEQSKE